MDIDIHRLACLQARGRKRGRRLRGSRIFARCGDVAPEWASDSLACVSDGVGGVAQVAQRWALTKWPIFAVPPEVAQRLYLLNMHNCAPKFSLLRYCRCST